MSFRITAASLAAMGFLFGGASAQPAQPAGGEPLPASALAHVAAAKQAAGGEFAAVFRQCPTRVPVSRPEQTTPGDLMPEAVPDLQAAKVLDDLYFVGRSSVSAWALNTPGGIILFDALNNFDDAEKIISGGLTKLGLDPASIKYVVVTHGHGDHFGGARYFAEKYGSRVIMSDADWKLVEAPQTVFSGPNWGVPPKRDIVATDGQKLTLGGKTVTLYLTPGHTPGTLSAIIPTSDRGRKHVAVLWGGTSMAGSADIGRFTSYADSADRFVALTQQVGADIILSNHAAFDGSLAKLAALRTRGPNQPNPFVVGKEAERRFFTVLGECAKANRAALIK